MLKRDQIKFTKDIKVSLILHIQVYITLHKPLVCDTKTRKVKDTKKTFVPRRKKWKLHEKKNTLISILMPRNLKRTVTLIFLLKVIRNLKKKKKKKKKTLLMAKDRTCKWTKGPAEHSES